MTNDESPVNNEDYCPSSFDISHSLGIRHSSFVILIAAAIASGCGNPSKANIQLRKDKQQLEAQIAELKQQQLADRARITGFESQAGSLPTLPQDRLQKLFTVHGIKLGRLTGGDPGNGVNAPDEGIKVYLSPVDETGEEVKATGTVMVEAFDLELEGDNRIGRWTIDPIALKDRWRSLGWLQAFVLELPWQRPPQHSKIAVKVTFRDELTGRVYSVIREAQVKIPATQPATRTAGAP
jgi:outer membrane murein-binding lipoprotein Lpp